MRALARIEEQFRGIEVLLGDGDAALAARAPAVSGWSVGQQVDHVLNVAQGVFNRLTGDSPELGRGINATGRILLSIGWFPRGVGRSPKSVLPAEAPLAARELERLGGLRADFQGLRFRNGLLASRERLFPHPYFGGLDPRQTLRFLVVHTHHHLKIVRDIRRAAGG
jgi:hypothetical protein